jgi:rhodanese-related sulfurtransferase
MTTTISAAALKILLESDELYAVVDVRDWGEFTLEQIPGTSSVPRGHLEKYVPVLVPNQDLRVVLYCRQGNESTLSALTLKHLGYANVLVLQGGFTAWKDAGWPSEQGLGTQAEFEELAIAEVGLLGGGPYGYSNERMAKYLKEEEELGAKYHARTARA